MKINITVKDDPRGNSPVTVNVDTKVHPNVTVRGIAAYLKKMYPWTKIIDIRIDLH